MAKDNYTFGDNEQASDRLRRLAELYEPETRALLESAGLHGPRLAVDLGCGPGWTTRLVNDVLHPERTVGLDSSERFIEEARRTHSPDLEFVVHDVVRAPFPVPEPDVLFCRFLLTHLRALPEVLRAWSGLAAPQATLLVHETETLETENPALRGYYELVAQMQRHYGQALLVGALLEDRFQQTGWQITASERRVIGKPAHRMAELHLTNLRTWRQDPFASGAFDARELDSLERSLERIAQTTGNGEVVVTAARQIVARRR